MSLYLEAVNTGLTNSTKLTKYAVFWRFFSPWGSIMFTITGDSGAYINS